MDPAGHRVLALLRNVSVLYYYLFLVMVFDQPTLSTSECPSYEGQAFSLFTARYPVLGT